jgi:hypothetical protein
MFLSAGARSKSSVRQKLVQGLASKITTTTPADGSVTASKLATSAIGSGMNMVNGTIVPSVAGSALTVALKTLAGNDPSAADPIFLVFRNATAATGDYVVLTLTAAISFTVSSGSTLGTVNSTAFRVWLVAFNDASTARLSVINCLSGTNIYPLGQFPIATANAEGGAGGADGAQTFYASVNVTSKAYAVLGYMTWETGLATAGTWSAGPTRTELFRPWTPLPGYQVQMAESRSGAATTGSTVIPDDDTIPQSTEGDQYFSVTITPTSAANLAQIQANADLAAGVTTTIYQSLFQDAGANAIAAARHGNWGANVDGYTHPLDWTQVINVTAATAFKYRAGPGSAATVTINGNTGARKFGGVIASFLRVTEIMV